MSAIEKLYLLQNSLNAITSLIKYEIDDAYRDGKDDALDRMEYVLTNPLTIDALLTSKDRIKIAAIIKKNIKEVRDNVQEGERK